VTINPIVFLNRNNHAKNERTTYYVRSLYVTIYRIYLLITIGWNYDNKQFLERAIPVTHNINSHAYDILCTIGKHNIRSSVVMIYQNSEPNSLCTPKIPSESSRWVRIWFFVRMSCENKFVRKLANSWRNNGPTTIMSEWSAVRNYRTGFKTLSGFEGRQTHYISI